jgi:hypothetical protein
VKQGEKVRPVLNVSLPEENSFNSNIREEEMEKVKMCSASQFSHVLVDAGKDALFCKFDQKDAYKNIPAKVEDFRLQGYEWLGKYFVETRQIFRARTAVANYDILGRIVLDLAIVESGVPTKHCMRQLDDVPMVSSKGSENIQKFQKSYKEICSLLNIKLAEPCAKFDKAFEKSNFGKVLGVWFKSSDLTWNLPAEKKFKVASAIKEALSDQKIGLLQMQKLIGRLNNITIMCPFLKLYTGPLYKTLGWLQRNETLTTHLSKQCRKDLQVFAGYLKDENSWNQIAPKIENPP